MRTYLDGNGDDSTAAVQAYLAAHRQLQKANLFVISPGPNFAGCALGKQWLLTDWAAPLKYTRLGTFATANIKRGGVESKIGLETTTVKVTWSPRPTDIHLQSGPVTLTALQAFMADVFDNGTIYVYRCVMPTPGDANTLGACLLFGGNVGDVEAGRSSIDVDVNSRTELLNAQIPPNVVEPTNILAQYSIGAFPTGFATPPKFTVLSGNRSVIYASPASGFDPTIGLYDFGHLAFHPPSLLGGIFRSIRRFTQVSGVWTFYLYEPLPFAPSGADQFTPLLPVPRDLAGAAALNEGTPIGKVYAGFPYVPAPETGL